MVSRNSIETSVSKAFGSATPKHRLPHYEFLFTQLERSHRRPGLDRRVSQVKSPDGAFNIIMNENKASRLVFEHFNKDGREKRMNSLDQTK